MEITTIRVSKRTKKRLEKLGQMGETFDQLINRLLDECEEKK